MLYFNNLSLIYNIVEFQEFNFVHLCVVVTTYTQIHRHTHTQDLFYLWIKMKIWGWSCSIAGMVLHAAHLALIPSIAFSLPSTVGEIFPEYRTRSVEPECRTRSVEPEHC